VCGIAEVLAEVDGATDGLVTGLQGLTDSEAREASLLPGWSRGHVLTHLARNAEGGTRLLVWARTGRPSYEYESVAARAQAIEDGAGRPARDLAKDVERTAEALREAAAAMPPEAWQHTITWTTGQETAAAHVPESRLAEVLLHHVDLNCTYRPSDWPAGWTARMLDRAVQGLNDERNLAPLTADLYATDTGREFHLNRPGNTTPRGSAAQRRTSWPG
jgi:maleylpyruvate isomerase